MNQLASATYWIEMGQKDTALSTIDAQQQSLLQSILHILEMPALTIAKIVIGDEELSDWS